MKLTGDLERSISLKTLLEGFVDPDKVFDVRIKGLQSDSRKLQPGDLFVALKGVLDHGLRFLGEALKAGCTAVIYDPEGADPRVLEGAAGILAVPVPGLSNNVGEIADRFFACPSAEMSVIAVTGTNGKTSCSHFVAEALNTTRPSAVIGTLGWGTPHDLSPMDNTTPGPIELQQILFRLRQEGCRLVAMEASSHGLSQGRMRGLRVEGALFTNFSRDHLDYHGTMEAYLESKLQLATWPTLRFVVFHAGEAFAKPILERVSPGTTCIAYAPEDLSLDMDVPLLRYGQAQFNDEGMRFQVSYEAQSFEVRVPLFGHFNVENVAGTLGVLLALGYGLEEAALMVSNIEPVPGRMERVECPGKRIIVDYAHTPDALSSALKASRSHAPGALWVVFGCGGNRDRGKRSQMGAVAGELADHLVITDDNPRDEDGGLIVEEILRGVGRVEVRVIRDRREAIRFAMTALDSEDLLLVAGKGHETTQEIAGTRYSFSDRKVIEEACREIGANPSRPEGFAHADRHGGRVCC